MIDSDKNDFVEMLTAILQVHGRPANTAVLQVWWGVLKAWPMEQVKAALEMFVRDGGNPVPASIVALLPDPLGHPNPEEAWNGAQKDENTEGAYMSSEMLSAVCAASDSIERGDMIGARRCFIDVYKERVKNARLEGKGPQFRYFPPIAVRWDQKKQIAEGAAREAAQKGWISSTEARHALEQLDREHGGIQPMSENPLLEGINNKTYRLPK